MQAQIKTWGNNQGIRIPKDILQVAGKAFKHKTLEERAAEYNGQLNFDGEYDWGTPVGREVW